MMVRVALLALALQLALAFAPVQGFVPAGGLRLGASARVVAGSRHSLLSSKQAGRKLASWCQPLSPLRSSDSNISDLQRESGLLGEDAAVFELSEQSLKSWGRFLAVLGTVMTALYFLWINNDTGFGDDFVRALESVSGGNSHVTITLLLGIFAVAHSGLASLRPLGEQIVGARAWRVLFGVVSLPLAVSAVVYFINHRYDGAMLWDLKSVPGVHALCWALSFVSFGFLYPSTFNLLEVAAVDEPQLHLWETGITRITRHPQAVGQGIWCAAHSLWVGTSFTLLTSALLMAHHLFSVWNGDRRLKDKHGDAFDQIQSRTSVMPFQAILDGRQELPSDYWKEFARGPYLVIAVATVGAYFAHPYMQAGSYLLHW
jgi:zeta-carotene isomerase